MVRGPVGSAARPDLAPVQPVGGHDHAVAVRVVADCHPRVAVRVGKIGEDLFDRLRDRHPHTLAGRRRRGPLDQKAGLVVPLLEGDRHGALLAVLVLPCSPGDVAGGRCGGRRDGGRRPAVDRQPATEKVQP